MRLFLGLLLSVSGCAYDRVTLPPTAEAGACSRECEALRYRCIEVAAKSRREADDEQSEYWRNFGCDRDRDRCIETCPGAKVERVEWGP